MAQETHTFEAHLNEEQWAIWTGLTSPAKIQAFLDSTAYAAENVNRSPLRVLRDRRAHCLDGGLFAAAALRRLGYPPIIVDLLPEEGADDDHVLAIYKYNGFYGAVAKSNFVGLRFRDPVYRTLRELVMSYFEVFFNIHGEKTLRAYTVPLNLNRYDPQEWLWNDAAADAIEQRLKTLHRFPVLSPELVAILTPVDARSYEAGMWGTDSAGLYQPKR
ncbi:MAG TPA: hypothetical protein PLJ78_05205 [Anaerolineae bacterium]|nr:hypothetical protein [Anaerolineae bacterium]HQK13328.1 hypothetical protein [Anaerolineae bacterium]